MEIIFQLLCYLELHRFWNMRSPFVFDCVDMGVKTYIMSRTVTDSSLICNSLKSLYFATV